MNECRQWIFRHASSEQRRQRYSELLKHTVFVGVWIALAWNMSLKVLAGLLPWSIDVLFIYRRYASLAGFLDHDIS